MKISRLEIFGFKSFLERIVLPVDQGITAIVGPNGCGKSNIVDALRWVFGETRASQLRGALLEDVIFNGTETLRPLGLAEVSIVIATDKESLYEDILSQKKASDAAVLQSVEQYDQLGDADRAAEEQIELEERGLNSEGPSDSDSSTESSSTRPRFTVIDGALSQRTIDPESEPLQQSEELLGSSVQDSENPDSDKAESEARVLSGQAFEQQNQGQSQLESNLAFDADKIEEDPALARFAWLKLSREVEITRRLYRSGESEFFINKVACRLRDLKDLFRLLGLGARSYTLVAQGEVSKIITSKPEERRLMIEEAAGVSGVRERLAAAEKRLDETKLSLTRLNDLLIEVTRQVNSLRVQATRAKNRAELKERLKFLDLSVIGDRFRNFSERGAAVEAEVQGLRERELYSKEQLDLLLETEESIQRELVEYNSRRETISQQLRRGRTELAAHQAQRNALESEALAIEQQLRNKSQQFEEIAQRAEVTNEQLENAKIELEQFTDSITLLQARMNSLEKSSTEELQLAAAALEAARNQSAASSSTYMEARSKSLNLRTRIEALDEQLNSAVSEDASDSMKSVLSALTPLLSHIHAGDEYRKALEVSIAHCADLQVCKEDVSSFVSRLIESGDLASAKSSLKIISLSQKADQHQSGQQKLSLSQPRLLSLLEVNQEYAQLFEALLGQVYLCESIPEALGVFEQLNEPGLAAGLILVTKGGELLSSDGFALYRESSGPVEKYARRRELASELEECERLLAAADSEKNQLHAALGEAELFHAEALQRSMESEQEIRRLSSELGATRGKAEVISRLVSQLGDEKQTLESSQGGWQEQKHSISLRLDELRDMLEVSAESASALMDQETLDQLEEQLEEINCRGKEVIDSLEERSKARDQARAEYEELTGLRSRAEFELEKIVLAREASEARLHDLYPEINAENLLSQQELTEEERATYAEEAERLRTRIQREGEVDPESIVLFEQEEARLNELKVQKSDLEAAEKTLAETVTQLSDLARKRFLETFKIVQANFARLIPRVFGGGFGSLQLENHENPFEGGIEVSVRPPGKKPKSIELLSGGERALCAIAMIFSMFLHKPSPLCVLDEVDAPLDEANLRRYLMMVREMSSVTQFFMISHNKEAMAAADRLVGVTQEQPGASQIVTVSLEQALAHVA